MIPAPVQRLHTPAHNPLVLPSHESQQETTAVVVGRDVRGRRCDEAFEGGDPKARQRCPRKRSAGPDHRHRPSGEG